MIGDRRVFRILEHMADSGQSAEEACADQPELLGEVKEQLDHCRKIDAQMDALFGPCGNDGQSIGDPDIERLPGVPGYHIISISGRGGMGIVYRARHLELNRIVALKMIRSGVYASAVERVRFVREARAIAALRHQNIVQVFDVGVIDGCPFFTMEFVAGHTLAESMQGKPLAPKVAVQLMLKLAGAVESAHQNGIVHRDLKPSNILIDGEGTPRIGDFGLARSSTDEGALTLSGLRLGTPNYMAPEQAAGRSDAIGPAADIYSLGAILYETLTGRPPFRGESVAEIERQLLTEEPVPPGRLNTSVPRNLETICLKCLLKQPHRRYQSAAEFADDLGRFQRGEPVLARNAGAAERCAKWMRRHPAITTGITAAALILLVLVGSSSWWFSQRASKIRSVDESLRYAVLMQQQANWPAAESALERAAITLGNGGPAELRHRFDLARRDSDLAARLEAIRMGKCQSATGDGNYDKTDTDYAAAFKDAGFGTDADPAAVVADRINHSMIRLRVLDALDDWRICLANARALWLIDVAAGVDPKAKDPNSWRAQLRDARADRWNDPARIRKLVETADVDHESVALLLGLMSRYILAGSDPTVFQKRIQHAHPGDFWANFLLANRLTRRGEYPEAIRFYQAAIAVSPDAAMAHHNLGKVLTHINRIDEGIVELTEAVRLNPTDPVFHAYLGNELRKKAEHRIASP